MTLEEIKKSIECHYDYKCEICPNNEELGSGEIVCISRLLPEIIDCINNLQSQLAEKDKEIEQVTSKLPASYKKEQNQKAIEQLTEIRDYVKNCWSLDTTEGKVRLDIAKKIRLKIEQLKEMK